MINDLIGLEYELGAKYFPGCTKVDCFSLFSETRRRLGLPDCEKEFEWAYNNESLPTKAILKAIKAIARRTEQPLDGDLAVVSGGLRQIGLGAFINNGILTIAHGSKSFWTPSFAHARFYRSL